MSSPPPRRHLVVDEAPTAWRGRLVLRRADGSEVCVGIIDHRVPCDLALVEELLALHLRAARAGGALVVRDADADLRGLLELVGVHDLLLP